MASVSAPLERPRGTFSVNTDGVANYVYELSVPPGIGKGNEPSLAFMYSHSGHNGLLGLGWNLGGASKIQRSIQNKVTFGSNAPVSYDPSRTRFAIDGQELLNLHGDYGQTSTTYGTEIEQGLRIVANGTNTGASFVKKDREGRKCEYGTTTDSKTLSADGKFVREWRIKSCRDVHGNCITYNYADTPQALEGSLPATQGNTEKYLDSIEYTSNVGVQASRFVYFYYGTRNDKIVVTGAGDHLTMAFRLSAVKTFVKLGQQLQLVRGYALEYQDSKSLHVSQLISITEHGSDDSKMLPLRLEYATETMESAWFGPEAAPLQLTNTVGNTRNIGLMPLQIGGKGFTDMGLLRYNDESGDVTLTGYLASISSVKDSIGPVVQWQPSSSQYGTVNLPNAGTGSSMRLPQILPCDFNADGLVDLLIPYSGAGSTVYFQICTNTGDGFESPYVVPASDKDFTDGDSFLAIDSNGDGTIDVLQICAASGLLSFNVYYFEKSSNDQYDISNVVQSIIQEDTFNKDDRWQTGDFNRDGVSDLLRIWTDSSSGSDVLTATVYIGTVAATDNSVGNATGATTYTRGESVPLGNSLTVFVCDINGDGIEDVVACTVDENQGSGDLIFHLQVSLCDGAGGFVSQPVMDITFAGSVVQRDFSVAATYQITNLHNTGLPTITYLYRKTNSDWACLMMEGSHSAQIYGVASPSTIFDSSHSAGSDFQMMAGDFNGSGKAGWLGWSMSGAYVASSYNMKPNESFASSFVDSHGARYTPEYKTLSDPSVYSPDASSSMSTHVSSLGTNSMASKHPSPAFRIKGSPQYVVSSWSITDALNNTNPDIPISWSRKYHAGYFEPSGHGWLGFERIEAWNNKTSSKSVQEFSVTWPNLGNIVKEEVWGKPGGPSLFKPTSSAISGSNVELLRRQTITYESPSTNPNGHDVFRVNKSAEKLEYFESSQAIKTSSLTFVYDNDQNVTLQSYGCQKTGGLPGLYQTFEICSYKNVGAVTGVMTARKRTTVLTNSNLSQWQQGDLYLTIYAVDNSNGLPIERRDWSTSSSAFRSQKYTYDPFGNCVQTVDPSGLKEEVTWDPDFKTYPLATKYTAAPGTGSGVTLQTFSAWDARYGVKIGEQPNGGVLHFSEVDPFGRPSSTCVSALPSESSASHKITATSLSNVVMDPSFKSYITSTDVVTETSYKYSMQKLQSGGDVLYKETTKRITAESDTDAEIKTEFYDCDANARRTRLKHGSQFEIWTYSAYDERNLSIAESRPLLLDQLHSLDEKLKWAPEARSLKRVAYDALSRPVQTVQPKSRANGVETLVQLQYSAGGDVVVISEGALSDPDANSAQTYSVTNSNKTTYISTTQEKRVIETVDTDGKISKFTYDDGLRLSLATDPSGKPEISTYDNLGNLLSRNNIYTNPLKGSQAGYTAQYDQSDNLIRTTNAKGDITQIEYDAQGRFLKKILPDQRTIEYVWDTATNGVGQLAKASVFTNKGNKLLESSYEFEYDNRAKPASMTLTLGTGERFTSKYQYNLQGVIIEKTYPDGVKVSISSQGSLTKHVSVQSGSSQVPWQLDLDNQEFHSLGLSEKWSLTGSGATNTSFSFAGKYGSAGLALQRTLNNGSTALVNESYTYDAMNRLASTRDNVQAKSKQLSYQANRLMGSKSSDGTERKYAFDTSGNVVEKGGIAFSHVPGSVTGKLNAQTIYQAQYDAAGNMVSRTYQGKTFDLTYDGFGKISSIQDTASHKSTSMISDFSGRTLIQQQPDGTRKITVAKDYVVTVYPDGTRENRHDVQSAEDYIGSVTTRTPAGATAPVSAADVDLYIAFTDTKGTMTHSFNKDGSPRHAAVYDEFGARLSFSGAAPAAQGRTFESRAADTSTGFLDFGARHYDPILGQFITPDDRWNGSAIATADAMNCYAFENNDPVNTMDPTGHGAWIRAFGILAAIVLVVAAVAVTVLSAGTLAPFIASGLASAAFSAVGYTITHWDKEDSWTAAGELTFEMLLGFGIGFVGGVAFKGISMAAGAVIKGGGMGFAAATRVAAVSVGKFVAKTLLGAGLNTLNQLGINGIEQSFGKDSGSLSDYLIVAAAAGGFFGLIGHVLEVTAVERITKNVPKSLGAAIRNSFGLELNFKAEFEDFLKGVGAAVGYAISTIADALDVLVQASTDLTLAKKNEASKE